jgi:predicted nucleotide-binding protein
MVDNSSFALLVMTAEDEQADGNFRARQNVVHEAGLFQGRLGFARAILLLEEGVQEFTNVQGVQYLQFARGNIKEVFGDILATLRREFNQ